MLGGEREAKRKNKLKALSMQACILLCPKSKHVQYSPLVQVVQVVIQLVPIVRVVKQWLQVVRFVEVVVWYFSVT